VRDHDMSGGVCLGDDVVVGNLKNVLIAAGSYWLLVAHVLTAANDGITDASGERKNPGGRAAAHAGELVSAGLNFVRDLVDAEYRPRGVAAGQPVPESRDRNRDRSGGSSPRADCPSQMCASSWASVNICAAFVSEPLMNTSGARGSASANPRNSSGSSLRRLLLPTTPLTITMTPA
jgi:hypothetical protein